MLCRLSYGPTRRRYDGGSELISQVRVANSKANFLLSNDAKETARSLRGDGFTDDNAAVSVGSAGGSAAPLGKSVGGLNGIGLTRAALNGDSDFAGNLGNGKAQIAVDGGRNFGGEITLHVGGIHGGKREKVGATSDKVGGDVGSDLTDGDSG